MLKTEKIETPASLTRFPKAFLLFELEESHHTCFDANEYAQKTVRQIFDLGLSFQMAAL